MESTLLPSYDMVRPWRRVTFFAAAVAGVEFVLLIGVGVVLLANPFKGPLTGNPARTARHLAVLHAAGRTVRRPGLAATVVPVVLPPRSHLRVLVLNGNGRSHAAARAAGLLRRLGYHIAGIANAARQDYATTLVMYRPGYRAEGKRLARDLSAPAVDPFDGPGGGALHGGDLTVILGA